MLFPQTTTTCGHCWGDRALSVGQGKGRQEADWPLGCSPVASVLLNPDLRSNCAWGRGSAACGRLVWGEMGQAGHSLPRASILLCHPQGPVARLEGTLWSHREVDGWSLGPSSTAQ